MVTALDKHLRLLGGFRVRDSTVAHYVALNNGRHVPYDEHQDIPMIRLKSFLSENVYNYHHFIILFSNQTIIPSMDWIIQANIQQNDDT